MTAEAVKVIVRCRPMNGREKDLKCKVFFYFFANKMSDFDINPFFVPLFQPCVFMDQKVSQCSIVKVSDPAALPKSFTFDGVYHTDSQTEQIYNEIAYPLVEVRNCIVFFYFD